MHLRLMTFNVRVWTRDTDSKSDTFWKKRMERMRDMINRECPDIICFQEMNFPATCYIPSNYRRVGISASHSIFVKKGISTSNHKFKIFYEYCKIADKFYLFNVHTRWEENVAKNTFSNISSDCVGKKAIICGDMNATLEDVRKNGLKGVSVREELGLEPVDTFQNYTKEYQHGEIDHFITVNMGKVSSYKVIEDYSMSDHRPVMIEFDV